MNKGTAARDSGARSTLGPASAGNRGVSLARPAQGNEAFVPARRGVPAGPLTIAPSNDPLEAEADHMAAQVLGRPEAAAGLRRTHAASPAEERLQRLETGAATSPTAPQSVMRVLHQPGTALPASSRAFFESRFGVSLGGVRVHDDAEAARSADAVAAHAYTVGDHVVFGAGEFQPGTPEGDRLLAHELAHVVQGGNVLRRESWSEKAGKWYDETKWAAYRGMISGLKAAKNAGIVPLRGLVRNLDGATATIAMGLLDVVDFCLDMIIALLLVIVGMAVGFAEGIVGLVTGLIHLAYGLLKLTVDYVKSLLGRPDDYREDCAKIVAGLTNLIPAMKQAIDAWIERYKRATLEEQVLMGGEVIGQIEAFIATFAAAGAKGGKALTITVNTSKVLGPEMAMARVAVTVPAVATKTAAEGAVVTAQMMAMSGGPNGGGAAPAAAAPAAAGAPPASAAPAPPAPKQGIVVRRPGSAGPGPLAGATDQEIAAAVEGMKPAGEWLQLGEHGGASRTREALKIAGSDAKQAKLQRPPSTTPMAGPAANRAKLASSGEGVQSAHGFPQSLGRSLPGYDPDHALTWLMRRGEHSAMDAFWKDSFKAMRAAGKTKITAQEAFDLTAASIRRAQGLSAGEKSSLIARLQDEMFVELGLKPAQELDLPYANIKPTP